jgi:hypoxanthine phosphoribosyltransferase
MAKERTMNEIRQTKEYYTGNNEPVKQECQRDPVEEAKILIVDKITKHFSDFLFEMVNEEMGKNYVFQSQNYLTEAGYEQFEDEWFEFYHDHHGDIIYEVMQNITN